MIRGIIACITPCAQQQMSKVDFTPGGSTTLSAWTRPWGGDGTKFDYLKFSDAQMSKTIIGSELRSGFGFRHGENRTPRRVRLTGSSGVMSLDRRGHELLVESVVYLP